MIIPAVKLVLLIGGIVLLIDALASLQYVHDKRWFCQAVRLERTLFALLVMTIGVWL